MSKVIIDLYVYIKKKKNCLQFFNLSVYFSLLKWPKRSFKNSKRFFFLIKNKVIQ